MGLHNKYNHIGHINLPDGREVHVEMDERGNTRSTLVHDEMPQGGSEFAWAGMESRAMPRALWRRESLVSLKQRVRLYNDSDISGSSRGSFTAGYAQLVEVFGEPNADGDEHKISTAWNVYFDDKPYHIYDYKETDLYASGRPTVEEFRQQKTARWNVGGVEDGKNFLQALHRAFDK